jgi:hypothetical protein
VRHIEDRCVEDEEYGRRVLVGLCSLPLLYSHTAMTMTPYGEEHSWYTVIRTIACLGDIDCRTLVLAAFSVCRLWIVMMDCTCDSDVVELCTMHAFTDSNGA